MLTVVSLYVCQIVLDKTGTITTGGNMSVTDVAWVDSEAPSAPGGTAVKTLCVQGMLLAEEESSHPIATALKAYATNQLEGSIDIGLVRTTEIAGRGLTATLSTPSAHRPPHVELWLGNDKLMKDGGVDTAQDIMGFAVQNEWEKTGKTVVIAALRLSPTGPLTVVARFAVADQVRPEARQVIGELNKHYQVWMLSGDTLTTAQAVAQEVGIRVDHVVAGVMPEAKADYIASLQRETVESKESRYLAKLPKRFGVGSGRKRHVVLFVGGESSAAGAKCCPRISPDCASAWQMG